VTILTSFSIQCFALVFEEEFEKLLHPSSPSEAFTFPELSRNNVFLFAAAGDRWKAGIYEDKEGLSGWRETGSFIKVQGHEGYLQG